MVDLKVNELASQSENSSRFSRLQVRTLAKRIRIKFIGSGLSKRAMFFPGEVSTL